VSILTLDILIWMRIIICESGVRGASTELTEVASSGSSSREMNLRMILCRCGSMAVREVTA
jgi:hypothetical protein